jgi:hypothetical protein
MKHVNYLRHKHVKREAEVERHASGVFNLETKQGPGTWIVSSNQNNLFKLFCTRYTHCCIENFKTLNSQYQFRKLTMKTKFKINHNIQVSTSLMILNYMILRYIK